MIKTAQLKKIASELRIAATKLAELKEAKKIEKQEKCASIILAKVGLEELKNNLINKRR